MKRIIESRNKREGRYAGRTRYRPAAGEIGRPHHCRTGSGYFLPLRHPGDGWTPGPHAHHYDSWSCL